MGARPPHLHLMVPQRVTRHRGPISPNNTEYHNTVSTSIWPQQIEANGDNWVGSRESVVSIIVDGLALVGYIYNRRLDEECEYTKEETRTSPRTDDSHPTRRNNPPQT